MTILNTENCLLCVIDVQDKLLNAVFNSSEVERNSDILAKASAALNIPTFITEQYPKGLGQTIDTVRQSVPVSAQYFEKTAFNALSDTNLLNSLNETNRKQVILCGIETHICVHQTANALLEAGFEVHLAKDACGSRSAAEYESALKYMEQYGVNIKTTEMILFELLRTAKHPNFKDLQSLIK